MKVKMGKQQNHINYSKELEKITDRVHGLDPAPRLLLHSCCAPCSSHCLEYLREFFDITVYYYNPNITQAAEYEKRMAEEKRLIAVYNRQVEEQRFTEISSQAILEKNEEMQIFQMHSTSGAHRIKILEAPYDPESFLEMAKGLEEVPEGGERCFRCYRLRLQKTAQAAAAGRFDFFTTTLTISPLKNAAKLNEIGQELAAEYDVSFLPSDFKKKNGYKRSIELSAQFGLYRQNYCGCGFSKAQRDKQTKKGDYLE